MTDVTVNVVNRGGTVHVVSNTGAVNVIESVREAVKIALPGPQGPPGDSIFADLDALAAATVLAPVIRVYVKSYDATVGPDGGAWYKRAASEPSHALKIQDASGQWWEIDEPEIYVEMAGAVGGDSSDDAPAIQAAIDAIAAQGGGAVRFGPETYNIGTQLLVSTSNVMLDGTGPAAYRATQSAIQASASTRLKWVGATGGTVVKFESPAGGERQHGGGMRNIMIDGNNFSAAHGLHILSWQNADFENIYSFACSETHFHLDITANALTATPYDTQRNRFVKCMASTRGGSGTYLTSDAVGWLLRGKADNAPGANTSFNYFYDCGALMSVGVPWLLENTDNNHFFTCSGTAQRDAAQYEMIFGSVDQDSYAAGGFSRYNFLFGCQLKIHCRASQTGGESSRNNFIILSRANNTPLPVFEAPAGGSDAPTATVIDTSGNIYLDGVKVLGPRQTGWTAMAGTADKTTSYNTATVTLEQLARRVKALQDAAVTHGLIGT